MRELSYGNMLSFGNYTFDFPDGKSSAVRTEVSDGRQTPEIKGGGAAGWLPADSVHAVSERGLDAECDLVFAGGAQAVQ
jgi:hypothetical protein